MKRRSSDSRLWMSDTALNRYVYTWNFTSYAVNMNKSFLKHTRLSVLKAHHVYISNNGLLVDAPWPHDHTCT